MKCLLGYQGDGYYLVYTTCILVTNINIYISFIRVLLGNLSVKQIVYGIPPTERLGSVNFAQSQNERPEFVFT